MERKGNRSDCGNCAGVGEPRCSVYQKDDSITINPVPVSRAKISTFNDHRIAMTFSMATFALKGEVGA